MTTYLVTGATGFLGGQLVERLLADPEAVVHVLVRDGSRGSWRREARRWTGGERVRPSSAICSCRTSASTTPP